MQEQLLAGFCSTAPVTIAVFPLPVWNETGTPIASLYDDDQTSDPIPLGFSFAIYGKTFDSVHVSTNGFLSFTSTSSDYTNQPLPSLGPLCRQPR